MIHDTKGTYRIEDTTQGKLIKVISNPPSRILMHIMQTNLSDTYSKMESMKCY
jgi:hypothetical protein